MILKEILDQVNIEQVKMALKTIYFQEENFDRQTYQDLFDKLKAVPLIPSDNHMTLHVEFTEDFGSSDCIWSSTYSLFRRYKKKYSLQFATLEEIGNALVREDEITNKEEYVAHILWERLYNHDSEQEQLEIIAEEKKRREMNKPEYCSIEDVLDSLEEAVFDE